MAHRVDTRAIAIQRYPYAETSQIVHFLTEDVGRVGVLVRGAFRAKNSYQGPIDLLVRSRVTLQLIEGRELGTLLSREVETAYAPLRRSLVRFTAAGHLMSLVLTSTPVGHGDAGTFQLLDRGLRALENLDEARVPLLLLSFDLRLLRMLGLNPQLGACVRCGAERRFARFSAADGGVLCQGCCQSEIDGVPLARGAWGLLRELDGRRLEEVESPGPRNLQTASRVLHSHLQYHLDWSGPEDLRRRSGARRRARR